MGRHTLYTSHNAQGKRTHQASEPQRRPGRPGGGQEGREAEQTRGGEAPLGLHQGEEAAGPREQAVLLPRREDEAHLHRGQDQGLRHGQAPQGASLQLDDEPPEDPSRSPYNILFSSVYFSPPPHTLYMFCCYSDNSNTHHTHTRVLGNSKIQEMQYQYLPKNLKPLKIGGLAHCTIVLL